MSDTMREMVNLEAEAADKWRGRAQAAELWWVRAAPVLADISRRFTLPESQMTEVRRLLQWEPDSYTDLFDYRTDPCNQPENM